MPYLKFFVRYRSKEELDDELRYSPPTPEEWEMMLGYEPTKTASTYEEQVRRYDIQFRLSRQGPQAKMVVDKLAVEDDNSPAILQTEQRPDFIAWVGE